MAGNPHPALYKWACTELNLLLKMDSSMKKDNTSKLIQMASYPEAVHIAAICSKQWKMSDFHLILSTRCPKKSVPSNPKQEIFFTES